MTVCNQNRVHCERLRAELGNCSTDCDKLAVISPVACGDGQQQDHQPAHDGVPNIVDRHNKFLYYYMNIRESVRLRVGHHFEDMLKFCSFKGKNCLFSR